MTVEDLADYLKMKPQTLRDWAKKGRIPYEPVNSEIRFRRSVIDKWIDENRAAKFPTAQTAPPIDAADKYADASAYKQIAPQSQIEIAEPGSTFFGKNVVVHSSILASSSPLSLRRSSLFRLHAAP
jgi:excisionase family DNA binding protein